MILRNFLDMRMGLLGTFKLDSEQKKISELYFEHQIICGEKTVDIRGNGRILGKIRRKRFDVEWMRKRCGLKWLRPVNGWASVTVYFISFSTLVNFVSCSFTLYISGNRRMVSI